MFTKRSVAALALGAAFVVVGCSNRPATEERRVRVMGDSLVNGTASVIADGLRNAGWDPVVDGRPGWNIGMWAGALAPVVDESRPRVAVVVLGTNDCAPECRNVTAAITDVMTTLVDAGVERVFWLNVQEDADYPARPDAVNAELAFARLRWPQLSLVDLSGTLGGRPEIHTDTVHFNEAGGLELTKLIIDAIADAGPTS
jgi:hypothetical protein